MEWDANLYKEHSDFQFRIGQAAIAQLKPRDGERILEIGCGAGKLTALMAKMIPRGRILATDISQNMVEKARETVAESGATNVDFECIDAMTIKYNREFDAIFSNTVIHLICWKDLLFERLFGALKSGGRMMLTAPFTNVSDTQKDLVRAHFTNIDLREHSFEVEAEELFSCMQSGLPDLFTKNKSPKKRERMLKTLRTILGSMLSTDTVQVNKDRFRIAILFIASEKEK